MGDGINAYINVENPPFGNSPYSLFEEMKREWAGWQDRKTWTAAEGECSLSATHDATGHVTLTPEIENRKSYWKATADFIIEAGQLNAIASKAKTFFSSRMS